MSLKLQAGLRVLVYGEAIDMRAGFTKLQALVTIFDGMGLVLIIKRLDRGQFRPIADFFETGEIALGDLDRILDCANLRVIYAAKKAKRDAKEVA